MKETAYWTVQMRPDRDLAEGHEGDTVLRRLLLRGLRCLRCPQQPCLTWLIWPRKFGLDMYIRWSRSRACVAGQAREAVV